MTFMRARGYKPFGFSNFEQDVLLDRIIAEEKSGGGKKFDIGWVNV